MGCHFCPHHCCGYGEPFFHGWFHLILELLLLGLVAGLTLWVWKKATKA